MFGSLWYLKCFVGGIFSKSFCSFIKGDYKAFYWPHQHTRLPNQRHTEWKQVEKSGWSKQIGSDKRRTSWEWFIFEQYFFQDIQFSNISFLKSDSRASKEEFGRSILEWQRIPIPFHGNKQGEMGFPVSVQIFFADCASSSLLKSSSQATGVP